MMSYDHFARGRLAVAFIVGSALLACSSNRGAPGAASAEPDDRDPLEVSCEIALVHLEQLIESSSNDDDFPEVVLIEAKELHQIGKELYLEQEYALALEFIEEGIRLLEENSG